MAQNLDLNINVNTDQAGKSIGSLKAQLREAQADVVALSDKFGATSKEAIEAAKRAAELRDRIGDARALTEAFNPDAKFKALTASLSGVAGGFAAVQGAMALFGSESEDLQKTLVKVQSAMALSQGLQAVGESIDSFKQLGAVIKTQVVSAFSTLRGAIIATGVGALAIGVGLLIANFDKVKETLTNLFPGLIEFGNQVKSIVQGITDFVGVTSKAARAQDDLKLALETSNKAIDNQIKILEAQGGKEEEIYEQKKQRINNQIKLIKGSSKEELQARADLNTELKVLEINEANRIKKANEDAAKERADERNAENKKIEDEKIRKAEEERVRLAKAAEDAKAYQDFEVQRQMDANKWEEKAIEDKKAADEKAAEDSKAYTEFEIKLANDLRKVDEDNANAKLKLKQTQANEYQQLSANLISVLGKDTIAGKAIGIATATINTFQGASEALKQKSTLPSPFDVISKIANVTAIIATGLKTVKSIAGVQVPGGGGGGGGGSIPSISTQAPMVPQLPQAQTTNISSQSINDMGNQAVRAYVIETDVTSNQQRMAAIRQRARFT
jgi:chromosome segregation ATPase